MKINKILLKNFGSYENTNILDTKVIDDKNIILIGGKNGAGKTTLFTAIRICLYGFMSMGYKSKNSFYNREIIKLINNQAKMKKPVEAEVTLSISLSNGQELDYYDITRNWILNDTLVENFKVLKNDRLLDEEETGDFQKYIFSLIPPELFNIFFFDGEKIADFFMDEGSDNRIKNAFLTLCGYDTFEIMRKNFKRVANQTSSSESLQNYITAKEELTAVTNIQNDLLSEHSNIEQKIENCNSEIELLEKNYKQSGGITTEEWNLKLEKLKDEEKKREEINAILKKWANDRIPFLMIRNNLIEMKNQLDAENNKAKYDNFSEIFNCSDIREIIKSKLDDSTIKSIEQQAFNIYGNETPRILDFSFEDSAMLMSSINNILAFDENKIYTYKKYLKKSLALSAKIRKEIENSSITQVQEYLDKKNTLFQEQNTLLIDKSDIEKKISENTIKLEESQVNFNKSKALLEDDIKKQSINDIAAKAIVMLDEVNASLYSQQIKKVEKLFKKEIKTLMRKKQFIDDIFIDDTFKIHIYKKEEFSIKRLIDIFSQNSVEQINSVFCEAAIKAINKYLNVNTIDEAHLKIFGLSNLDDTIVLPIEIDKTSLSNGEKQIFIMALYHSLVQLCNLEIPFIIDTPFARIDTEHRRNISKYFFKQLSGQVFVLSTNEEIDSDHVKLLDDKIAHTYILENSDNKRTEIVQDTYFKEEL